MTLGKLFLSEIACRKRSFLLGMLAVGVATGALTASIASLRAHDRRTQAILFQKERQTEQEMTEMERDIERAMQHLGFNMIILPQGQETSNWLSENYAAKTMPEAATRKLKNADIPAISDILPVLRQKIEWPETGWSVIISGKGANEGPPPIGSGEVELGHEIHSALDKEEGETLKIMGHPFNIAACLKGKGNKKDVTIWMNLADVQQITDNPDLINEIHIREYNGRWRELSDAKGAIHSVLPGTRIVERNFAASAKIMAFEKARERKLATIDNDRRHRAKSRATLQRFAFLITVATMLICVVWIGLLAAGNVHDRLGEIAVLRSIGLGGRKIILLFFIRVFALAVAGGVIGWLAGSLATSSGMAGGTLFALALLTAIVLTFAGSLHPILRAVRSDPASIFQEAE